MMCTPTVVDANCINKFQNERISDVESDFTEAINHIFANGWINLDENGLCQQEWLDCAAGPAHLNLKDWIAERIIEGAIRVVRCKNDPQVRSALLKFGLPNKDHKWVQLAFNSKSSFLVTEDIDLFDPKAKKYSSHKKEKIRNNSDGALARHCKNNFCFLVIRPSKVKYHISTC